MSVSNILDNKSNLVVDVDNYKTVSDYVEAKNCNLLSTLKKNYYLSTNWVSVGDSWTIPSSPIGGITTFTSRLNTDLQTSYNPLGVGGWNLSNFWDVGYAQKFYYSGNTPFYSGSVHVHAGINDLLDPPMDQTTAYLADNITHLCYVIRSMLFTLSLPPQNIYLPKNWTFNSDFVQTDATYYGCVRASSATAQPANSTITSPSGLSGRYYYVQLYTATTANSTCNMQILIDGVVESNIYFPAYNNSNYCRNATSNIPVGVLIDMKTVASRVVQVKCVSDYSDVTGALFGMIYCAVWDDNTPSQAFRQVLIDDVPLYDYSLLNSSVFTPSTSNYQLITQAQTRWNNLNTAIELCVRDLRKLGLPINMNRWNNATNSWIDSNQYHPTNSMCNVNEMNIINKCINTVYDPTSTFTVPKLNEDGGNIL